MRKFAIILAALAFGLTSLAPTTASAQRHRGGHGGGYNGGYNGGYGGGYGDAYGCRCDNNYGCERDRDRRYYGRGNNSDAVAAGVIGLVLGAALASSMNNNRNRNYNRNYDPAYDNGYRNGGGYNGGYNNGYGGGNYDPAYDDPRYAPPPPQQCMRAERQWDRYANRYVTVDVPC